MPVCDVCLYVCVPVRVYGWFWCLGVTLVVGVCVSMFLYFSGWLASFIKRLGVCVPVYPFVRVYVFGASIR